MSDQLDPYGVWLGITDLHPLTHYQLLGLRKYEPDLETIWEVAIKQMALVLQHDPGPHSDLARKLFDELDQARTCLCDPEQKSTYDAELRREEFLREFGSARERVKRRSTRELAHAIAGDGEDQVAPSLAEEPAAGGLPTSSPIAVGAPKRWWPDWSSSLWQMEIKRPWLVGSAAGALCLVLWFAGRQLFGEPAEVDRLAPLLIQLAHRDPQERQNAAHQLGQLGPLATDAVPHLVKLVKEDPYEQVRLAAAEALLQTGPAAVSAVPELSQILPHERHPQIRAALKGLVENSGIRLPP